MRRTNVGYAFLCGYLESVIKDLVDREEAARLIEEAEAKTAEFESKGESCTGK